MRRDERTLYGLSIAGEQAVHENQKKIKAKLVVGKDDGA